MGGEGRMGDGDGREGRGHTLSNLAPFSTTSLPAPSTIASICLLLAGNIPSNFFSHFSSL